MNGQRYLPRGVTFEFRRTAVPGVALMKIHRGGRSWQIEIPLPYPVGDDFWERHRDNAAVMKEVRRLALQNSAPNWVTED